MIDRTSSLEPSTTGERERGVVPRVARFLVERFPPAPQLVLMTVLFVAATTMAELLLEPRLVRLGDVDPLRALAGFLGSLLFILRLRIHDDIKDADTDRRENPTRPIPRGLVRVRELDVAAIVVLVVEGLLLASVGWLAFGCWAVAAAWSMLMRVEFFVPEWLERHVATYAISHMVVMGLIFGALLAIGVDARGGTGAGGDDLSVLRLLSAPVVLGVMVAATIIGIGFEWGRKFERYHEAHGEHGWSLWLLWPSVGVIAFASIVRHAYPIWAVAALAVVGMFTIAAHALVMGQRDRPSPGAERGAAPAGRIRDLVEAMPGAAGLLLYLVLAAAGVTELVS